MNKNGVSPVIGIILLTAVTVALVSLAAFFVFDVGQSNSAGVGTATVTADYESESKIDVTLLKKSTADRVIVRSTLGTEYILNQTGESIVLLNQESNQTPVVLGEKDGERSVLREVPPRSFTPDIVVGSTGQYSSLSSALANASDSDIIVLKKDTYYENVDVTTANVTVVGETGTVIADNGSDDAVLDIQASGVRVSNVNVRADSSQDGQAAKYGVDASKPATTVRVDVSGASGESLNGSITEKQTNKLVSQPVIGLSESPAAIPDAVVSEYSFNFGNNARAFGVDTADDNGYAVGGFDDGNANRLRVTRYDENGNESWTQTFDKDFNDNGKDVAIDTNGNVIFGGTTYNGSVNWRVLKYYSNGTEQWNLSYDNAGGNDGVTAVTTDSNNNVIVVGTESESDGNTNWRIAKYNPNGNLIWEQKYKSQNTKDDEIDIPYEAAIDSNDNIIVSGFKNTDSDVWRVVKYSSAGDVKWVQTYNGATNGIDRAVAVDVDSNDDVVVAGMTLQGGDRDWRITKYTGSGNPLWNQTYDSGNGTEDPETVEIGTENSILVGGYKKSTTRDWRLAKFEADGTPVWNETYNGTGEDILNDVAVDKNGDIIAVGYSETSNGYEWRIEKYTGE